MYELSDPRLPLLAVIIILLVGLTLLVTRWSLGVHKTFSQHAAAHPGLIIYYSTLFAITLPILLVFFTGWFVPIFELPDTFVVCIIISAVFQFLCTLIPETKGWRVRWHRILAGISALFLLPCLVILLGSAGIEPMGKIVTVLGILVMSSVIVMLVTRRATPTHSLILQIAYFTAFFAPVVFVSYAH